MATAARRSVEAPGSSAAVRARLTPTPRPSGAFDLALGNKFLYSARERYALEHGDFGTREYRSAWLAFSRKVRTLDDLRAARAPKQHEGTRARSLFVADR